MFYARSCDEIIIPIFENYFYFSLKLHSPLENTKTDGLKDVIGGIGMSLLKRNKNEFGALRNCILLRCTETQLNETLKNCCISIIAITSQTSVSSQAVQIPSKSFVLDHTCSALPFLICIVTVIVIVLFCFVFYWQIRTQSLFL